MAKTKAAKNNRLLHLGNMLLLSPINQQISRRHDEDGKKNRRSQPADDGAGHGGVLLAALTELHGHRKHSDDGGERRHEDGPQADAAGRNDRVGDREALFFEFVREVDDQNAVRVGDSDQHQHAHQRHDIQGGMGKRQNDEHADEAHGNREHDEQRIDKRSELGDQNQKEEDERNPEADGETLKGGVHALNHAAQIDSDVRRQASIANGALDRAGELPEILAGWSHIDVHDALDLVVVDLGGRLKPLQRYDGVERRRLTQVGSSQRDLFQVHQVPDGRLAVLGILHAQEVVVAGLIIHPVIGSDHGVGIESGDDVIDDVLLREPQLGGVNAVHIQ